MRVEKRIPKIKKRKIKLAKVQYYVYCPICNKEIKGTNASQVSYNLKIHLDKHKRKNERR